MDDVGAWAVVAVSRCALDVLRSARIQREAYVGPWLPEPLIERTAWVLHDLFGLPFTEVAEVVGRGPAAVRQLAARARAHVRAGAPRMAVSSAEHRHVVNEFFRAASGGDLAGLVAVLDPGVVLTADGGGQATAARRPVRGAEQVARFLVATAATISAGQRVVPLTSTAAPAWPSSSRTAGPAWSPRSPWRAGASCASISWSPRASWPGPGSLPTPAADPGQRTFHR